MTVSSIEEVYFNDPELQQSKHGQLKYSCVSAAEPAGKPIANCQMVTVALTLIDEEDTQELSYESKSASIEQRKRRLLRISGEARECNGLLSQGRLNMAIHRFKLQLQKIIAALCEVIEGKCNNV